MKEVKLRMNEQEKYNIIKELVDHNDNKNELVKSSVYLEDKLIVLLLNIRKMENLLLFTAIVDMSLVRH